jgi:hypothetical protein
MREFFVLGGWGMWPTLLFGALMIAAGIRYATRPEKRFVPLLISLGVMTVVSGSLGFATGLAKSLLGLYGLAPEKHYYALLGLGESLMDVVLALILVVLATMAATVGAWRLARTGATGAVASRPIL